jgi:probable HAF family extracellular repeat protein
MTDLGHLGGANAGLFELNHSGIGVGFSETGALDPLTHFPQVHAVISDHGRLTDLGTLGGSHSWASAIDDRGDVSGFAENTVPDPYGAFLAPAYPSATQWRATLWRHGRIHDLGGLGGTLGSSAWLNDAGELAGTSDLPGDQTAHPFLWNGHRMIDLGTLGGDNGSASWVSDSGAVSGSADLPGGEHHGFLWKDGIMSDLPPVDGAPCANAESVGENGDVVGNATDCHGTELAAILWRRGRAYDHNDRIAPSTLHLTTAAYANRRGEIFTIALLPNGDSRIVLLVPAGHAAARVHLAVRSAPASGCAFSATPLAACRRSRAWQDRAPWNECLASVGTSCGRPIRRP